MAVSSIPALIGLPPPAWLAAGMRRLRADTCDFPFGFAEFLAMIRPRPLANICRSADPARRRLRSPVAGPEVTSVIGGGLRSGGRGPLPPGPRSRHGSRQLRGFPGHRGGAGGLVGGDDGGM